MLTSDTQFPKMLANPIPGFKTSWQGHRMLVLKIVHQWCMNVKSLTDDMGCQLKSHSKSESMHKKLTGLVRCLCYICAAERAARQLFLNETCDVPETFQPLKHEAVCNQFITLQGCSTICVIIFPKYLGKIQMVSDVLWIFLVFRYRFFLNSPNCTIHFWMKFKLLWQHCNITVSVNAFVPSRVWFCCWGGPNFNALSLLNCTKDAFHSLITHWTITYKRNLLN